MKKIDRLNVLRVVETTQQINVKNLSSLLQKLVSTVTSQQEELESVTRRLSTAEQKLREQEKSILKAAAWKDEVSMLTRQVGTQRAHVADCVASLRTFEGKLTDGLTQTDRASRVASEAQAVMASSDQRISQLHGAVADVRSMLVAHLRRRFAVSCRHCFTTYLDHECSKQTCKKRHCAKCEDLAHTKQNKRSDSPGRTSPTKPSTSPSPGPLQSVAATPSASSPTAQDSDSPTHSVIDSPTGSKTQPSTAEVGSSSAQRGRSTSRSGRGRQADAGPTRSTLTITTAGEEAKHEDSDDSEDDDVMFGFGGKSGVREAQVVPLVLDSEEVKKRVADDSRLIAQELIETTVRPLLQELRLAVTALQTQRSKDARKIEPLMFRMDELYTQSETARVLTKKCLKQNTELLDLVSHSLPETLATQMQQFSDAVCELIAAAPVTEVAGSAHRSGQAPTSIGRMAIRCLTCDQPTKGISGPSTEAFRSAVARFDPKSLVTLASEKVANIRRRSPSTTTTSSTVTAPARNRRAASASSAHRRARTRSRLRKSRQSQTTGGSQGEFAAMLSPFSPIRESRRHGHGSAGSPLDFPTLVSEVKQQPCAREAGTHSVEEEYFSPAMLARVHEEMDQRVYKKDPVRVGPPVSRSVLDLNPSPADVRHVEPPQQTGQPSSVPPPPVFVEGDDGAVFRGSAQ